MFAVNFSVLFSFFLFDFYFIFLLWIYVLRSNSWSFWFLIYVRLVSFSSSFYILFLFLFWLFLNHFFSNSWAYYFFITFVLKGFHCEEAEERLGVRSEQGLGCSTSGNDLRFTLVKLVLCFG